MTTPFGAPAQVQPRSVVSTLIVDPAIGFDVARSPLNLPAGATPNSDNFLLREGRLTPRPMLSKLTDVNNSGNPVTARMLGGAEIVNVAGTRYLLVAPAAAQLFWLQGRSGTWTAANYASAFGVNDPPTSDNKYDYWDWTQIFYDRTEENIAVGARIDRHEGLYCWEPGSVVFSTLTGSPGARCVVAFDNYLLAANLNEGGETFIQRIRWSDRGSASSWTGGLSGFEDLLSAKGGINRMLPLENRIAIFFDDEIWMGSPIDFPHTFRFDPFDPKVGCPYPWTATETPLGIVFMARNFQLYLLPKTGGPAQPIGQPIHRSIRNSIVQPGRAFGLYDGVYGHYQFYFSSGESGNLPHRAAFLDLASGAWAPQSFASSTTADIGLTRGFGANIPLSRASTWDDLTPSTWSDLNVSWDDLLGLGNERQVVVLGTSSGTVYTYDSTVTSDDGSPVRNVWESQLLGEQWPGQQKTMQRIDIDYVAPSASSLSVRALQGTAFAAGERVSLTTTSAVSQVPAYPYVPSRYAAIRVEAEGQPDFELHRFHVTMRIGGR